MNPSRWIALHCSEDADTLQSRHPNAFLLLSQIARRARFTECKITGLKVGEAEIGDWKRAGLKSENVYRTAKSVLQKAGLVAFRTTNKGTIATLCNSAIYSVTAPINHELDPSQPTRRTTTGSRASHDQITTNSLTHLETITTETLKDSSIESKRANNESQIDLPSVVSIYPRRQNMNEAVRHLQASISRGEDLDAIIAGTRAIAAVIGTLPSGHLNGFVPSAATFYRDERWKDDPQTWIRRTSRNGATQPSLDLGGRRPSQIISAST